MILRLCVCVVLIGFSSFSLADQKVIQEYCESEWADDTEMFNYCVDEQNSALQVLQYMPKDEISARCAKEWQVQYDMQEHCSKERRKAKANIEKKYSGHLRATCESEWGTEYEMVEYCIKENGE